MAFERKSVADLFQSIGSHRHRFLREVRRLSEIPVRGLVIEGTLHEVDHYEPYGHITASQTLGTVLSWFDISYHIPARFCGSRDYAKRTIMSWMRFGKRRLDGHDKHTLYDICPICGGGGPVPHRARCRASGA